MVEYLEKGGIRKFDKTICVAESNITVILYCFVQVLEKIENNILFLSVCIFVCSVCTCVYVYMYVFCVYIVCICVCCVCVHVVHVGHAHATVFLRSKRRISWSQFFHISVGIKLRF